MLCPFCFAKENRLSLMVFADPQTGTMWCPLLEKVYDTVAKIALPDVALTHKKYDIDFLKRMATFGQAQHKFSPFKAINDKNKALCNHMLKWIHCDFHNTNELLEKGQSPWWPGHNAPCNWQWSNRSATPQGRATWIDINECSLNRMEKYMSEQMHNYLFTFWQTADFKMPITYSGDHPWFVGHSCFG